MSEKGWIKLKDYNMLKNKTIVENDDELEIDKQALNEMINDEVYEQILNDYKNKETVCKNNLIPLSFLYTRLAKEGKISYNSKEYLNNVERI